MEHQGIFLYHGFAFIDRTKKGCYDKTKVTKERNRSMSVAMNPEEIFYRCAAIFDEVADAVYVCDLDGRLLFLNRAAEKLDGFRLEVVKGKDIASLYGTDERRSPLLKSLSQQKTIREPRYSYWIQGKEVAQSCVASPLFIDGVLVGAYSVQHDLTEMRQMVEENLHLQQEVEKRRLKKDVSLSSRYDLHALIGESESFAACRKTALRAAETDSSVMLVGATGSGKEMFARAIHENSPRKNGPFLALNCAAIPEELLEGILFGTAKGVYTGAVEREGLLRQAEGGTVFLDEMNSMSMASQAKLLRVLEEKEVYKLGAAKGKAINVRLISSCNESPQAAVERGAMREDLFYRLSVVYIPIPSLSERREDIPLLVEAFISDYNKRFEKSVLGVAENVMAFFMTYDWKGNVRQLKHCIESAMNFTESGQWIGFSSLPPYLFDSMLAETPVKAAESETPSPVLTPEPEEKETTAEKTVMEAIREEEKAEIIAALRESKGNMAKAARMLGINRQAMVYRVKKYGLK